jgi:hypothetical protein
MSNSEGNTSPEQMAETARVETGAAEATTAPGRVSAASTADRGSEQLELQPQKAPESQKMKAWNRRIMQIGCLPLIIAGFLAAMRVPYVVEIGTALAIFVAGPIAVYSWLLRRRNQAAFDAARAEAQAKGMRVRVVEHEDGDNEYIVEEPEKIERLEDFYDPIEPDGS